MGKPATASLYPLRMLRFSERFESRRPGKEGLFVISLTTNSANKISPDSDRWGEGLCWGEINMRVAKRFNSMHVPLAVRKISFSIGH